MVSQNRVPYVSVVIPTYNRAQYVTEAVESVLAQTYTDYEIIVVDDGSTDDTHEVLQSYMSHIRYIFQENAGASAARNRGISEAKAEWIAFLDSDDVWLPQKLAVQIEDLSRDPRLCLHTTNATLFRQHIGKDVNFFDFTGFSKEFGRISSAVERPLTYQVRYGIAWSQCALIQRKTLFDVGLFDQRLTIYEDQDLMCRLALDGRWYVSKRELVRINRRNESIDALSNQRTRDCINSYKSLVYLYDRLSRNDKLQSNEKRVVTETLCKYKTALGMELMKTKQKFKARELFQEVVTDSPSLKSVLKYILSFLPSAIMMRIVANLHRLRRAKHVFATSAKDTS